MCMGRGEERAALGKGPREGQIPDSPSPIWSRPRDTFLSLSSPPPPVGSEPVQLFRKSKCGFPRQESDRTGRGDGHRGDLGCAAGCVSFVARGSGGDWVVEK